MSKVSITSEAALAVEKLEEMCAGFHYEMYCKMNKYLFGEDYSQIEELQGLIHADPFKIVDAIRYGYEVRNPQ